MNKKSLLSAFLTAILIAGLVLASAMHFGTVHASTPKPSVPEFTLKFVDNSYDEPPTYSIDPYTGENVTHPGYHVKRINLEMTIKNQPFSPFYDEDSGWNILFYYNIRIKGHYSEDWTELYRPSDGYPTQSDSEYTVISLGTLGGNGLSLLTNAKMMDIPSGGQVDFQVEAMIGYIHRDASKAFAPWIFTGETSGWSSTQTLTIGESQTPTPSPATTPTPTPTPAPTPIQVPGQSSFSVESNSTVTNLFFNSTSSELSFTVNGTSETAGYLKVTIAKSLVSSVQNIKVYLDGAELDVAITSDENSWLLSFNYLHSTHDVRISLAADAVAKIFLGAEFWVGVVVIVVVVGVFLLFYFKKRNR